MLTVLPTGELCRGKYLSNWFKKLNPNQMNVPCFLLALHPCLDGGHACRHQPRGGYGWRRNRERDKAVHGQGSRAGEKSSQRADIQSFSELHELLALRIAAAYKERHLQVNSLSATALLI